MSVSTESRSIPKKPYYNPINKLMYDQNSQKVPNFYSRPGPGMYENNKNLERLSKFQTSTSVSIGHNTEMVPQHRFSDY